MSCALRFQAGEGNREDPVLDPVGDDRIFCGIEPNGEERSRLWMLRLLRNSVTAPAQFPLRSGSPLLHCGKGAALQSPAVLSFNEATVTPGPQAASTDEAIWRAPRAVKYSAVKPGIVEIYPFFTRSFQ